MSDKIVNCWNSIGVWGKEKPRCPVLDSVIHCQNCEKYTQAGRQALAREIIQISDEELLKYSEVRQEKNQTDTESIMILRLGDEWFAIPSKICLLVSEDRPVHSIPHLKHDYIKGIVNITGEVQLCFSLGALLGVKEGKEIQTGNHRGLYNCLIVISFDGRHYVFPASEFRGLYRYHKSELLNIPATIHQETARFLTGVINWNTLNIGCINTNLLFSTLERKIQ